MIPKPFQKPRVLIGCAFFTLVMAAVSAGFHAWTSLIIFVVPTVLFTHLADRMSRAQRQPKR